MSSETISNSVAATRTSPQDYETSGLTANSNDNIGTCIANDVFTSGLIFDFALGTGTAKIKADDAVANKTGLPGTGPRHVVNATAAHLLTCNQGGVTFERMEYTITGDSTGYNYGPSGVGKIQNFDRCIIWRASTNGSGTSGGIMGSGNSPTCNFYHGVIINTQTTSYVGWYHFSAATSNIKNVACYMTTTGWSAGGGFFSGASGTLNVENVIIVRASGTAACFSSCTATGNGNNASTDTSAVGTNKWTSISNPYNDAGNQDLSWADYATATGYQGSDLTGTIGGTTINNLTPVEFHIGAFEEPSGPAPNITTTAGDIDDAGEGQAYGEQVEVDAGEAPLTWSFSAGTPPDGLTIDVDVDNLTGLLEGPVSEAGDFSFTVRCTDPYGRYDELAIPSFHVTKDAITVSEVSVDLGTTIEGNAGTPDSFDVDAAGLDTDEDITVGPTSGLEFSKTGAGGTYASTQTLEESGGVVNETIHVRLAASAAAGSYDAANILITADDCVTKSVGVTGEVTEPDQDIVVRRDAVDGTVKAYNSKLGFGEVSVGQASAWIDIFVLNTGDSLLTIGTPELVGPNAADWELDLTGIDLTIAPAGNTSFRVRFKPLTVGAAKDADLSFDQDDDEVTTPFILDLDGDGTAPPADDLDYAARDALSMESNLEI